MREIISCFMSYFIHNMDYIFVVVFLSILVQLYIAIVFIVVICLCINVGFFINIFHIY